MKDEKLIILETVRTLIKGNPSIAEQIFTVVNDKEIEVIEILNNASKGEEFINGKFIENCIRTQMTVLDEFNYEGINYLK